MYLDEYARIFPKYQGSFRNIKLLLATNEVDYEGLVKIYEVLDKGSYKRFGALLDVVLYDKVCKAIGEDSGADKRAVEFMGKPLLEEKSRLEGKIKEYEELVQERYQKENEEYMEQYADLTEKKVMFDTILLNLAKVEGNEEEKHKIRKEIWSRGYKGITDFKKRGEEFDIEYRKVWDNRPSKGIIPKEEYEDQEYLENKVG